MTKLILRAYIPSTSEYDKAWEKYRAFMGAELSEKAKREAVWEFPEYKKGSFFLRNQFHGTTYKVAFGLENGSRYWSYSDHNHSGLRVAFNFTYSPKCKLVRNCKMIERKSLVYENKNGETLYVNGGYKKVIKSRAPIITLKNGTPCIWLNKDDCEEKKSNTIQLWTLDLVEKAAPFAKYLNHKDFGKAEILRNQCETWLENNLSNEEKKMVVPIEMSDEDDYEMATPLEQNINIYETQHVVEHWYEYQINKRRFELTQYTDFESIKNAFVSYKMGEIDSQAFMEIVDKAEPEIEEDK